MIIITICYKMKIKKLFQQLFKKLFRLLFKFYYGKIEFTEINNVNLEIQQIKYIKFDKNTFYVDKKFYMIKNARIYTDLVEHVAIIKDNKILPQISYQQISGEHKSVNFNKVYKDGTPRLLKKIKGNVLSLVQGASGNNYFHFLFDVVAKLNLCDEIIPLKNINYFYLPGSFHWQKKILSTFNIFEDRIIDSRDFRHIKADEILAMEHPWYQKGYVQDQIKHLPEWIIYSLRDRFLKCAKKFKTSDKIFIDRSDSMYNHCKLVNNDEVIEFLSNNGYQSYQVSKLDFFEQIYLFNNAKIIIGPHGAAFTNIIFSKVGLKIVEFVPYNHKTVKCEKISNILGFNYKKIKLKNINNFSKENGDMRLDLNDLEQIILSF